MFPSFVIHNIIWDSSDHPPIIVKACKDVIGVVGDIPGDSKPFRFEVKWLYVKEFREVVESAWRMADRSTFGTWTEKINHCARTLDKWGKNTFKNIHRRLRWLLQRLKYLRGMV